MSVATTIISIISVIAGYFLGVRQTNKQALNRYIADTAGKHYPRLFSEIQENLELLDDNVEETTQNFKITPDRVDVEPIGPQGKTEMPYLFEIEGNLNAVGTYHLTVELYCNGYEITSHTRTLYVD